MNTPAPRQALDLTRYHARRTFGDITAIMTWWLANERRRPCLVLVPTTQIGREQIIPCVVPQDAAWAWAEETGDGRHCARTSAQFAAYLGLPEHPNSAMRVTFIIRECMGDLLTIPPMPVERDVVADAIRTDSDGREHHSEIMSDAAA